ncbi:HalOD1 output domain-containing protein [Haloprofundus halobius]|uniref:HalOD1 output domain-containing protein n=1 Tax=Haloprofundus halobius TaxID=2876194 RepID=UPI001CCC4DC9|nr:HalOD1 output domain-containing protein [Haloprofundus halobius]
MTPTDDDSGITQSSGDHDGPPNGPLGESDYVSTSNADEPITTEVRYEVHDGQSTSEAVVFAVAEAKGCNALEVDEPLYNWIDPDALDAVFRLPREDVSADRLFSFQAYGREVTVVDTRAVHVSYPLDT